MSHIDTPAGMPIKMAVNDLHFYFGKFQALKGISVHIPDKKVTAVIGPSGCGKSTFLRCMNRIYELYPDRRAEGEIWLDGQNILDRKINVLNLRSKVGMVFQEPTPFPISIYDNVLFGIRLNERLPRSEQDGRVEHWLRKVGLWEEVRDVLRKRANALSGGQKQRLCIARAIAINPEVVLLDEPCSALDPRSTARIENLIQELSAEYCIVLVTHNMAQAARCSNYTAFMLYGELVEFGDTEQMFQNPRDQQTEDYIEGRFG